MEGASDAADGASASSWWSGGWSMISSVAEKVVEAYKEDLGEFVGAVTADTGKAVEDVKQSEWVASAKALATNNTLVKDLVDVVIASTGDESVQRSPVPTSRLEAKLAELQRDIGTYCTNPAEHQEASYQEFCKNFDSAAREQQIATLLGSSALLQVNHAKLVPVVVSYDDFWKRYIFRELRLREREEEREQLIRKASVTATVGEEEVMPWEDDDADGNDGNNNGNATATTAVEPLETSAPLDDSVAPATPVKASAAADLVASPHGMTLSPIVASAEVLDGWDDVDVAPLDSNDIFTKDVPPAHKATPVAPESDWAVDEWE